MGPRLEKLGPADYRTSAWSGGTTTQLAIFPPEARYQDRSFLWRISSATVELERSDFTPLPDYDRQICTLRGHIILTHGAGDPVPLEPYEVHAFSGADPTQSLGRCTDFNLMLRRGRAEGKMRHCRLEQAQLLRWTDRVDQMLLYCAEGSCTIRISEDVRRLTAGESLLLTFSAAAAPEVLLHLTPEASPAVLMICRMRQIES